MPAPEPGPEWVLSGVNPRSDSATESELLKAADQRGRRHWPTSDRFNHKIHSMTTESWSLKCGRAFCNLFP